MPSSTNGPATPASFAQRAPMLADLSLRLRALGVFRGLLADPVVAGLLSYLDCRRDAPVHACVSMYGEFVSRLYASGHDSLARYVLDAVCNDENPYVLAHAAGRAVAASMEACARADLRTLQEVANLTPAALRMGLDWQGFMPGFETERVELVPEYASRIEQVGRFGFGMYARFRMFSLADDGTVCPVAHPDPQRLSDLAGYEREKGLILANTRALLAGKPAANVLLSGDAGTGKSSTVKAVVNELAGEGLRIIEVRKDQLKLIPAVLDELAANPLKFIVFIDDLSFARDDDNYAALKAVLEGGVSSKSPNVVIYATSNRRHLVKESFSARDGDDIHRNDTMQETLSLSERFGLQISFFKPDKAAYLAIVRQLAHTCDLAVPVEELEAGAERFALGRGGRSARAARQYVDSLVAQQEA